MVPSETSSLKDLYPGEVTHSCEIAFSSSLNPAFARVTIKGQKTPTLQAFLFLSVFPWTRVWCQGGGVCKYSLRNEQEFVGAGSC